MIKKILFFSKELTRDVCVLEGGGRQNRPLYLVIPVTKLSK